MTDTEKLLKIDAMLTKFEELENYFTEEEQKFMLSEYDSTLKHIVFTAINGEEYQRDYHKLCEDYRKLKVKEENNK